MNPRVINALDQAGFVVNTSGESRENPEYRLSGGEYFNSPVMFSKKINHPSNPSSGFCAIMVCSDADESCPFVPGAEERISLPYHDPKEFDGTEQEELKYNERCRQIARDMFYMMLHVKNRL